MYIKLTQGWELHAYYVITWLYRVTCLYIKVHTQGL